MPTVEDVKSQLLQHWSIQSNLLVMIRSICITALSVLTAAVSILWPNRSWSTTGSDLWQLDFLLFEGLAGFAFFITVLWGMLQNDRGDDVNYLRARAFWADNAADKIVKSHKEWDGLIQWRKIENRCENRNEIEKQMGAQLNSKRKDLCSLFKPDRTMRMMVSLQKSFILVWVCLFFSGYFAFGCRKPQALCRKNAVRC